MQTLSESLVVSVDVGMYDLRFIAPNKKFNLIFEDSKYTKKYNGAYVIVSAVHTFNKKEKNTFYPTSRMILKRLKQLAIVLVESGVDIISTPDS